MSLPGAPTSLPARPPPGDLVDQPHPRASASRGRAPMSRRPATAWPPPGATVPVPEPVPQDPHGMVPFEGLDRGCSWCWWTVWSAAQASRSATWTRPAAEASRWRSPVSTVAITAPPRRSASATKKASTASSEPAPSCPSICPARTPARVSTGWTSTRSRRSPAKTPASAGRPRTTSASTAATVATGRSRARISITSARTRSRRRGGPWAMHEIASLSSRSTQPALEVW
jgi:hypothetical protein